MPQFFFSIYILHVVLNPKLITLWDELDKIWWGFKCRRCTFLKIQYFCMSEWTIYKAKYQSKVSKVEVKSKFLCLPLMHWYPILWEFCLLHCLRTSLYQWETTEQSLQSVCVCSGYFFQQYTPLERYTWALPEDCADRRSQSHHQLLLLINWKTQKQQNTKNISKCNILFTLGDTAVIRLFAFQSAAPGLCS